MSTAATPRARPMSSRGDAEGLAKDPANALYGRFDMQRLTAEEVRDSLLANATSSQDRLDMAWEEMSALVAFILNIPTRFEFEQKFFPGESKNTVFGFLCFDHHETDFFDEGIDASIGYIFADIISHYFSRLSP